MAKLDPLGPSLQNFPRQSHIFKAKLWFSLKVRALHKKIFTRPSILPKRHWTKTRETVSLKEKGPKTPWDVMGVKTTCLEAPGVSLGGSGVSIGGFRILRGEQMYCEGLAHRIFAYPACSYKSIALRIFKTSHFEYSHLEYSRCKLRVKLGDSCSRLKHMLVSNGGRSILDQFSGVPLSSKMLFAKICPKLYLYHMTYTLEVQRPFKKRFSPKTESFLNRESESSKIGNCCFNSL